jgi:hypothetical protein
MYHNHHQQREEGVRETNTRQKNQLENIRERFSKEWFSKESGCATVLAACSAIDWLIKNHKVNDEFDDDNINNIINCSSVPFDYCLRIAANVIPNPVTSQEKFFISSSSSSTTKMISKEFFVTHLPIEDENEWQNVDCVKCLAGPDRLSNGLPGHVLIVPRQSLHWKYSNITIFCFHAKRSGEEKGALEFLERFRLAALTYAFNRGWQRIGIYFKPWGNSSDEGNGRNEGLELIMRAHVVNLSRAGPGLGNSRGRLLTLDDAIEILKGRRKVASGRAIDVKSSIMQEKISHREDELVLVENSIEKQKQKRIEESRRHSYSRIDNEAKRANVRDKEVEDKEENVVIDDDTRYTSNVDIKAVNFRDKYTQFEDVRLAAEVVVEFEALWFKTKEGNSYVKLSNDAERKALELL